MVKAPRWGAVKRRLAADIGAEAALLFYRRTLGALLRRVARDPRWRSYLYVTPDRELRRLRLGPGRLELRPQGRGDLGRRMARPLVELPPGPVVIIGSDIPEIEQRHIAAAFARLGSHDAVFGPARDGGYWLVGVRRRPHLRHLFRKVRWSSEHALADSLAGLDRRSRVALLEELEDIDDGASYARYRARRRG